MRVIAGELGGRKLVSPDGTSTRPTTDRVREAVFNALGSSGILVDAVVADLYAGTGAVGIEAISRGAAHCTFVERDRAALRALDGNLANLDLGGRSRVVRSDAMAVAGAIDVDIVFADPPYDFDAWDRLMASIRAPFVVAEAGRSVDERPGWTLTRSKRYGRTWVSFLEREGVAA
ncbi:16S rRNA (guanine(966)-N(2))-methyltransferase RsmD [Ilumatobacter sp.]|uniref:16S rRNA (guanine(966)-N(2))-methyltransferase RsmD n=1 Tax=Ilumatobacter sp. TaxID=1967498 RepID=UPI003B52F2F9